MILSFALHAQTHRLAISRIDSDDRPYIQLRTLAGDPLGEIQPDLLALDPRWSPDGSVVAFFSNDGLLYLYHLGDPAPRPIFSDPSLNAGFCQWDPAGERLVFSAHGKAKQSPPNIYSIELNSGQVSPLTGSPRTVDRFPQWSPSGQLVAFNRQDLDEPYVPTRAYVVNAQSAHSFEVPNVPDDNSRICRSCWTPDETALLLAVYHPPHNMVKVVRLADGVVTWSYASDTLQCAVFSPNGDRILCVCADALLWFAYPQGTLLARLSLEALAEVRISLTGPEIEFDAQGTSIYFLCRNAALYRWDFSTTCERILEDRKPTRAAYTHEEYTVPSLDGRPVPVQRFIPAQPRSPAILYVHGGPGGAIRPDDPFMLRLLDAGVEFVCAAYRGSSGYGQEHQEANIGEYGRADVWDLLAVGRDWKERAGANRPLILAGYSYGGFLTLLALAQQDHPWAGGIVMYAVSGMQRMGLHQHKAFPEDPAEQARAWIERSPLRQAGHIRVPLHLFHGELDTSATTEEMQFIQTAIRTAGGDCELTVFSDDTHSLTRHRGEIHTAVLEFLGRFA